MCTQQELKNVTQRLVDDALALVPNNIYKIILYGSYARGDNDPESDIDVMVVLDCPREDILRYRKEFSKASSRIGLDNDIMLSVLLRDKDNFIKNQNLLPFYKNIVREGVELSDIITEAFDVRSDCDYDDFYLIDKNEVDSQIAGARIFLEEIGGFIERNK